METLLRPTSERDKLAILLIASMAVHLVLFGAFYYMGQVELPSFLMSTKDINIKLAKSSVRVDVVKMPELTIKELKSLQQLEAIGGGEPEPIVQKQEVVEDDKAFLKKKKKQDFMSMLQNLSQQKVETKVNKLKKKKVVKRKGPTGPKISGSMRGKLKKLLVAGNKLGAGTAIVGTGDAEAQTAKDRYSDTLTAHVRPRWKLPSYLMNQDLACTIRLYLAPDGELIKAEVHQSSGDDEYDMHALSATKNSSPFPVPADEISVYASQGGFALGFPL